jgi:crotonobetainyl-CoA:carnitine CoA-transferase CaiB-like acyl-CoA transferase
VSSLRPPLRVLEVAQGAPAAVCGRLLAGLGHDVLKVEPPQGDILRRLGAPGPGGTSALFAELNAGKRGVVRTAGTLPVLLDHAAAADVVIADADPALGPLAAEQLHERYPAVVVVAVSHAGLDAGPDLTSGDSMLAEAAGGLARMIGEPDQRPLALGGEQAAYATGIVAFFGATLALRRRDRTGRGELVDVSAVDVVAYSDWKSDTRHHDTGEVPTRSGGSAGRWRMLRARDGWVGVIFEPSQWPAIVDLVGDERLADPRLADDAGRREHPHLWWPSLGEWAFARRKAEIYAQAQRRGLPFGHVVTLSEVPDIAQYRSRGFVADPSPDGGSLLGAPFGPGGLPWSSSPAPRLGQHQQDLATPWAARSAGPPAGVPDEAPLAGLVVVDLGTITAGAAVGRMLADYGATVIKVESPDRPDAFRKWIVDTESQPDDPTVIAPMFDSNNAGKLGLALDLKSADGLAAFREVVRGADVLIENFGAGVTSRLGIDAAALREVNRRLVYLSLSSQGQAGPEAASRSYGSTLDLLSGLASVTGYDAEHPLWSSVAVNYPDQLASLFGAAMATYCVAAGATGVHLDLAQRELVTWTLADQLRAALTSGTAPAPAGNHRPGRWPHDVFPCITPDSWVAISCHTDEQRTALATVVGSEPAGRDALELAIAGWTADRPVAACVAELAAAGVPAAPVADAATRASEPRFARRRVFLTDGRRRIKGFPLVLHGYVPPVPRSAPLLGADSEHVLASIAAADRR